jgi:hypothetical protein
MEEAFGFARVVAEDESWFYLNYSHTHMWSVSDDKRPVRVDQTIASKKHIVTVLWFIRARWLMNGWNRVMFNFTILQGQLNLSTENIHAIAPPATFAGLSTIRHLSC